MQKVAPYSPAKALDTLPKLAFDPQTDSDEQELRRAELLQSVRAIARADHASESDLVREVVRTSLGHVPEFEQ